MQTRVGYAGGRESRPTYRNIGGHAEAIQIVFDPALLSFDELLDGQLRGYRPLGGSGQYRSAVFPRDDAQMATASRALAGAGIPAASERDGLVPPGDATSVFWDAEDYHQKYRLRRRQTFVAAMERAFGGAWDRYPVATKLNASIGGALQPEPWLALLPDTVRAAY